MKTMTPGPLLIGLVCLAAPLRAQLAERVRQPAHVTGEVFVDGNGNGVRDPGEAGLAGVAVSDQVSVVSTDAAGRFAMDAQGYGVVFIEQPDGYALRGSFWRRAEPGSNMSFAVTRAPAPREFTFVHASDTHLDSADLPRMRRMEHMVDSISPAFVLITGDLVRDALRVGEAQATGYFDMVAHELAGFRMPVHTVPGNHDIFGIERQRSLVSASHPLYGKRMYRSRFGPDYYAFDFGGVHFVGLDTQDYEDLWYHGHVDSVQLAWLERDLARLPPDRPVVTFNHIPLLSANDQLNGFNEDGPAPTTIRVNGHTYFRHTVSNVQDVLAVVGGHLEIALGGHMHCREMLRYETAVGTRRFYQTAAVTDPPTSGGPMGLRSGITVYHVKDGHVDDGTFLPLDALRPHS